MGIVPWVLRDVPPKKCMIWMSKLDFNADERALFDKMLQSVGLKWQSVSIQEATHDQMILPHPSDLLADPLLKKAAYAVLGQFLSV